MCIIAFSATVRNWQTVLIANEQPIRRWTPIDRIPSEIIRRLNQSRASTANSALGIPTRRTSLVTRAPSVHHLFSHQPITISIAFSTFFLFESRHPPERGMLLSRPLSAIRKLFKQKTQPERIDPPAARNGHHRHIQARRDQERLFRFCCIRCNWHRYWWSPWQQHEHGQLGSTVAGIRSVLGHRQGYQQIGFDNIRRFESMLEPAEHRRRYCQSGVQHRWTGTA